MLKVMINNYKASEGLSICSPCSPPISLEPLLEHTHTPIFQSQKTTHTYTYFPKPKNNTPIYLFSKAKKQHTHTPIFQSQKKHTHTPIFQSQKKHTHTPIFQRQKQYSHTPIFQSHKTTHPYTYFSTPETILPYTPICQITE